MYFQNLLSPSSCLHGFFLPHGQSSCHGALKNIFSFLVLVVVVFFVPFSREAEAAGLGDIRVRSALGEPFSAAVKVSASAGEALSADCFRLVEPDHPDGIRVLHRASLDFQRSGQGGDLHIHGTGAEMEPLLKLAIRLRCAGDTLHGITREYSVLLDPREYAPPTKPQVTAPRPASGKSVSTSRPVSVATSVWRVRAGDTAEGLALRYFPHDAGRREQFITDLFLLNENLPQDRRIPLPKDAFLSLPAQAKMPVQERVTKQRNTPSRQSVKREALPKPEPVISKEEGTGGSQFRLQLSTTQLDPERLNANISEEEKLKLRERALLLEADDQASQLLQLRDRIMRLEKQLASAEHVASAASHVAPLISTPAITTQHSVSDVETSSHVYWLFGGLSLLLVSSAGFFVWRRYNKNANLAEAERLFGGELDEMEGEGGHLSPPVTVATSRGVEAETVVTPFAGTVAPATWSSDAEVNVVHPNSLVEEAQLLMDHGLTRQAIGLLEEEIRLRPRSVAAWIKLFEACGQVGDDKLFFARASEFHSCFLSEALWHQVQAMGRELDPANALYQNEVPLQPDEASALQEMAQTPNGQVDFSLEFNLPELDSKGNHTEKNLAEPAGQTPLPVSGVEAALSFEIPEQDSDSSAKTNVIDYVSDDPVMQNIASMIRAGQLDEAYHNLEELLYRGTFEQRMLSASWLDKLLPLSDE